MDFFNGTQIVQDKAWIAEQQEQNAVYAIQEALQELADSGNKFALENAADFANRLLGDM